MAATLATDADVKNVAAFYAAKSAKAGFATNKAAPWRRAKIRRGGVAERKVPACPAATARRVPACPRSTCAWPASASYTEAQLLAFRDGTRKNNAQMAGVVAGMTRRTSRP